MIGEFFFVACFFFWLLNLALETFGEKTEIQLQTPAVQHLERKLQREFEGRVRRRRSKSVYYTDDYYFFFFFYCF